MFCAKRNPLNPFIKPYKNRAWEGHATFNWCPIDYNGKTFVVYRAVSSHDPIIPDPKQRSIVAVAETHDTVSYENRRELIIPEYDWEKFGCEDPRVVRMDGRFYIFYTALSMYPYSADGIRVAVAISDDMQSIVERHLVTPFNAKAMSLFPERINGKITAVLTVDTDRPPLPARIAVAQFDRIEQLWDEHYWRNWYAEIDQHVIGFSRRSESDHIEVGAPPVKTDKGWVMIYSYTVNFFKYENRPVVMGIEAALLDLEDPRKVIGQTEHPIMAPEEYYEKVGYVSNVIFPSGTRWKSPDVLDIYYGAADMTCCKAAVRVSDIVNSIHPQTQDAFRFERFSGNPILKPTAHEWESQAVFNPAAIELDGSIHILYRAMGGDNTSVMGYARTQNGFDIAERLSQPVYVPRMEFEMKRRPGNSGCEDPRIVRMGDDLHMFYTAYDGEHPARVAATKISVADFLAHRWNWSEPTLISPSNVDDKDTCIIPEAIHGRYLMIHRINGRVCADYLNAFDFREFEADHCAEMLDVRPGKWDSEKVGIAGQPIKTDKGWLLFYHGVSSVDHHYRLGVALLRLDNPTEVLARSSDPLLEPKEWYERQGVVPNVVFPCGCVNRDNTIFVYYGGADTVTCVATMRMDVVLNALSF